MQRIEIHPQLAFLTPGLREKLNERLRIKDEHLMPHALAVYLGIEYSQAIAILAKLKTAGACKNQLLIYHRCEPGVLAGAIPYAIGFPQLPWRCPLCEKLVESYDELAFDFEAIVTDPIELI
jgi:hypothetical protein